MSDAKLGIENINLGAINDVWVSAINAADTAKKQFKETAEICSNFFSGSVGFMWEPKFRERYLGGIPVPKFKMTIAKAFEYVSVIGPGMMWDAPGRTCTDYEPIEIFPELFGSPDDPNAMAQFQQVQAMYQSELVERKMRNTIMERYLNWTTKAQPGGGLRFHSHQAIIDGIVKGRGCLEVRTWNYEGSEEKFTGAFYLNVDDLYIDPDCRMANLEDAKWIAVKRVKPHDVVEREFGWPEGSLRQYASIESSLGANASKSDEDIMWRQNGRTNDTIVYYEIFSKCGVGTRFKKRVLPEWHSAFERSVGDYARICIVKGMQEPLNLTRQFMQTASMRDVARALEWETPYFKDGKWPIAMLDFYPYPGSAWPLAPLSMGLGELYFMNVFITSLADKVYRGNLDKIAVAKAAAEDAVAKLKSYNHEVIELKEGVAKNVNEIVSFVNTPGVTRDALQILEYISESFDKRVGLMEMHFGLTPGDKVIRTSTDSNNKKDAVSVRPEWMQQQVVEWQSQVASLEQMASGWHVTAAATTPLLGRVFAAFWDKLITNAPPETYVREMVARIEADSIRRPNREKDVTNLQNMGQWFLPLAQWYAQQTGNVEPINGYLRATGNSVNQDVTDWIFQPVKPAGPSPEEMQAQQEMIARESAKKEADIQGRVLKNNKLAHELIERGQGVSFEDLVGMEQQQAPPEMQGIPSELQA